MMVFMMLMVIVIMVVVAATMRADAGPRPIAAR
jgi:hypothetical protein